MFGALVNAGLDAFAQAAAHEDAARYPADRAEPGWVAETLTALGLDPADGTPVAEVARGYLAALTPGGPGTHPAAGGQL